MAKRSVIITGATSSIGAACAWRFAANGDRLILADKNEDGLNALKDALVAKGHEATFVVADVSKKLHVHNIVAEALEAYDRIDVLAHAHFDMSSEPFLDVSEDEFDSIVTANVRGAFLVNQAAAKQMIRQRQDEPDAEAPAGAIVNITSVEAVTAIASRVAFAATQGAVHQMTKAIALALSEYGVRANTVGIGAIKGDFMKEFDLKSARDTVPMRRIGDPEEVAEAVFFLASPGASYITGQSLYIDGGRMVRSGAAGYVDKSGKKEK